MPYKDREKRLAYNQDWYKRNSEAVKARCKKYRDDHKAAGICEKCNNPAIPGYGRCPECNRKDMGRKRDPVKAREWGINLRKERIEERKCTQCGKPLDNEEIRQCMSCKCNWHKPGLPRKKGIYKGV